MVAGRVGEGSGVLIRGDWSKLPNSQVKRPPSSLYVYHFVVYKFVIFNHPYLSLNFYMDQDPIPASEYGAEPQTPGWEKNIRFSEN